ncbi:MAG: leucyl/phenylalanyl-tRNA--protein transferase [Pyrinomonadaceae bacterium]
MPVYFLSKKIEFPPVELAHPDGLLAIGGDLSPERLILAYKSGIFPWYADDQPILWYSPEDRMVLYPSQLHVSRSLQRTLRQGQFTHTFDKAFTRVIHECAVADRHGQIGTWITDEMIAGYCELHRQGYAHSVETWENGELVGGIYGVSLGGAFFGESMFKKRSNASKAALVSLVEKIGEWGFHFLDCQVYTEHMKCFGAQMLTRFDYLNALRESLEMPDRVGKW